MRYLLIILLLLAGCDQSREIARLERELRVAQQAHDRQAGFAAAAMAMESQPPPPTPPAPGEQCTRCNGTGKIKPDGRIEIACPDCGGDGRLTLNDVLNATHEPTQVLPDAKAGGVWITAEDVQGIHEIKESMKAVNEKALNLIEQMKRDNQSLKSNTMPPPSSLNWLDSLPAGKSESQRTGKPALIHFTSGDNCQACVIMDRDVFTDATVRSELSSYVLVKIDVASLSDDSKARWAVSTLPADDVLTPDWLTRHRITFTLDPQEFADQLTDGVGWAKTKRRQNAAVQQPVQQVQQTERVVYIQSNGSTGGIVGGSLEPLQTYRSPVYYQQPTYYTPTYYTRPTLFPRYYGSGTTVCGPNGCYTQ